MPILFWDAKDGRQASLVATACEDHGAPVVAITTTPTPPGRPYLMSQEEYEKLWPQYRVFARVGTEAQKDAIDLAIRNPG